MRNPGTAIVAPSRGWPAVRASTSGPTPWPSALPQGSSAILVTPMIWPELLLGVDSLQRRNLRPVVVLLMSHVLAKDVSAPARELVDAMNRVGQGDLGVRMDVTSTDEFAELFRGFNQMTQGVEERAQLREAFGRYLGPAAEQVLKNGVQLGGELVNATILFADIRKFTTLSERMQPQAVSTASA